MPTFPFTATFATDFSRSWYSVWNRHDLRGILALFADDIAFSSPKIIARQISTDGWVHGKAALADYWQNGLIAAPDLAFQPLQLFRAPSSITLTYRSTIAGLTHVVAEVFLFNQTGWVEQAMAHHA